MEIVPLLCYRGEWRISGTKEGRPLDFYENREENRLQAAIGWIVDVIVMVLLAAFAVYCFGTRVQMRGSSMRPALESGDVVLINRLAYDLGSPKRFDIAAFARDDSSFNIRRVIGLPGETVQIIEGTIYIDGEPLTAEEESLCSASMAGLAEYPVELGEDEYFLLGDNRESSEDSRFANVGNTFRLNNPGLQFLSPVSFVVLVVSAAFPCQSVRVRSSLRRTPVLAAEDSSPSTGRTAVLGLEDWAGNLCCPLLCSIVCRLFFYFLHLRTDFLAPITDVL